MREDKIVATAIRRMKEALEADRDNREEALNDLEHLAGQQWEEAIAKAREDLALPVITVNRLPQFARQVADDIRKMNPAINIGPSDDEADADTADVIEGIIRAIQYRSRASTIFERAAESAAQCGMGFWRVLTEYESDRSFNQHIRLEGINNPFSVYLDPRAKLPNREDMGFCFITEMMDFDTFNETYPGKKAEPVDFDGNTDGLEYWRENDEIVVAEYFWKEPAQKRLVQLQDGTVLEDPKGPVAGVIKERTVDAHKVMWAKISGKDVLEGPKEFPCTYIPIVAVMGEEINLGREVIRTSVIRFAKDPQRLYNYFSSAQAEVVALQPKAPYLVTAKQVAGLETFWNQANDKNRPYLPYNPDEKAPPPQRAAMPVSSQGYMEQAMKAAEDMKATTGIYDASLGNRSNEQSGIAIRERRAESDAANSIYTDNMARGIEITGEILVEMIPRVYDTFRPVLVLDKEDNPELVHVNGLINTQDGPQDVNRLDRGKYNVRVSVGPNYSTRRQEAAESMIGFVQAYPAAAPVVGDLIARNMDWPGADQFAERLESLLPPNVAPRKEITPEEQQAQQQAMQMQQAMQQAEIKKTVAEANEADADAQKAQAEAMQTQIEVMAQTGQLNAAIEQIVQEQVARALMGAMQPGVIPQQF